MSSTRAKSLADDSLRDQRLLQVENGVKKRDAEVRRSSHASAESLRHSNAEDPELMASTPQRRNWKGIFLALLAIVLISSVIITASVLTTPREQDTYYGKPFTFSDMVQIGKWMNSLHYRIHQNQLICYIDSDLIHLNLSSMKERILLSHNNIEAKDGFSGEFEFSHDMSAVLLPYKIVQGFRHSSSAMYDVVQLPTSDADQSGVLRRVGLGSATDSINVQPSLPFAIWAPKQNYLAFVHHGHIYLHLNPLDPENSRLVNVTSGMPEEDILYGQSDWLYEEELLQTNVALWWSPSGKRLAFASFNEQNVSTYEIRKYGRPSDLYESTKKIKYPKAGDPTNYGNPSIGFFIYEVENKERREFPRPNAVPWDGLLAFIRWLDDDYVIVGWTNRIQNKGWISVVSWPDSKAWVIFETTAKDGWVEMFKQSSTEPLIYQKTKEMFIILPREYGDKAYRGVAMIKINTSGVDVHQPYKWMLNPNFDIVDILHYDGNGGFLILSSGPDPKHMHLYWAHTAGALDCLTCGNPNCTFNRIKVSENGEYFVQECRGPDPASFILKRIKWTELSSHKSAYTEQLRTLEDNTEFKMLLQTFALPRIKFVKLTLRSGTADQLEVECRLLLPPELNKSHVTKYPLLLHTYAGPSRQMVTTRFNLDWTYYLAATGKVIVATVDGRGTGGRGRRFEQAIYKNLGVIEIEDQLHAIESLVKNFSFINSSKIGAFGWSYGGFTVGHLLGHPENKLIRCGVSVAPVTDFRYYDTAYTERYLGRIINNPAAYFQTRLSKKAKNMRSKSILLIHGTADDNVHLMNTVQWIKALIHHEVDVNMMLYPDDNHSIVQRMNRIHLQRKVITFLLDCYNQSSIRYRMDMSIKDDL